METITKWINSLVMWLDTLPPGVLAILAGLVIGGLSTQWLKRTFPFTVIFGIRPQTAVMMIRIVGFAFSALPTYFLWDGPPVGRLWASVFVGFATPTVYKVATFFIYRAYPKLEQRLSGTTGTGDGR